MRLLDDLSDAGERPRRVRERLTQQDIADRIGASREMVSRIFKDLTAGGYLDLSSGRIVVVRKLAGRLVNAVRDGPSASTRSSQRFRSAISAAQTECGIGYSCHSTGVAERDERVARLARSRDRDHRIARCRGRGRSACRGWRRAARRRSCRRAAGSPTGRPGRRAARRGAGPVISVIAQPWLKPARTMRAAGDAARLLARDQRLDERLRLAQAGLVLAQRVRVEAEDVVPGAHHVAAVDRHRPRRRVREDEADRADRGEVELVRDRHEVVAVGAEAVQDDDGGARRRRGFVLDGRGHGRRLAIRRHPALRA